MGYGQECGEYGAFGQDERSAVVVGGASDTIPEAGVGHIDGQGIGLFLLLLNKTERRGGREDGEVDTQVQ